MTEFRHESAALLFGTGSAVFSADNTYRYRLARTWGSSGSHAVWIMLNPSTADALTDDPTIRRCTGFSKSLGLDGLTVVNLFALRATDPRELKQHTEPVGPANDYFIHDAVKSASVVIAAWGANAAAIDRSATVRTRLARTFSDVRCLGTTRDGAPRHPLYVRADQPLLALPALQRIADREAAS